MLLPLARADALDELARGALTLADVARHWNISPDEAYERLYDRPMPPPAALPTTERLLAAAHSRRRHRNV
jgi:hypothetical protein